jgi:hypothetical protein
VRPPHSKKVADQVEGFSMMNTAPGVSPTGAARGLGGDLRVPERHASRGATFVMKRYCIAFLLAIAACRTQRPPVVPHLPQSEWSGEGAVAAKLLEDPNAPRVRLGPNEEYVPPFIAPDNPVPEYPAELLALRLKPHVVVVRMIVDEMQQVMDISPSPLQPSTESPHRPLFESQVRTALQQWSVRPPVIRKFKPGPDADGDGTADYQIMVDQHTLKAYFDLAFTFEVVDGKGVVRSKAPQP